MSVPDVVCSLAVVDDDEAICRTLRRLLRLHGHRVQTFDSAEAYLSQHAANDCVILDIELPGISGLELEARLRLERPATPVVFITAHDEHRLLAAVTRTRRPLVRKPLEEDDLLAAISQARAAQNRAG